MKKFFLTITLFAVCMLIFFLVRGIYKKISPKEIANKNISIFPAFSFSTIDNKIFSNENLPDANNKIIINFFNPECEHCQYMAKSYIRNSGKLKDISLLMITIADSASIVKFRNDYHLDSLQNIIFLRDSKFQFEKIFGIAVVPSFFIYKNKKLVKKIIGETKIENLLK